MPGLYATHFWNFTAGDQFAYRDPSATPALSRHSPEGAIWLTLDYGYVFYPFGSKASAVQARHDSIAMRLGQLGDSGVELEDAIMTVIHELDAQHFISKWVWKIKYE